MNENTVQPPPAPVESAGASCLGLGRLWTVWRKGREAVGVGGRVSSLLIEVNAYRDPQRPDDFISSQWSFFEPTDTGKWRRIHFGREGSFVIVQYDSLEAAVARAQFFAGRTAYKAAAERLIELLWHGQFNALGEVPRIEVMQFGLTAYRDYPAQRAAIARESS